MPTLALALQSRERLDEAIAEYREAIRLQPFLAEPHCKLGLVLESQEKLDEAITEYYEATKVNPSLAEPYFNLGKALMKQAKLEEAIAVLRAAIRIKPEFADAHYHLGRALQKQAKPGEAASAFREAIRLDPDHAAAREALAQALALPSTSQANPSGNAVIRGAASPSEIVITTTSRVAGAIHSLTWNGKEFIDSFDHGRQMQSAVNLDCGKAFVPEVFNPTEAGSNADGKGEQSSSRLLRFQAAGSELQSTTQMAFWLAPGEKTLGHPALNTKVLSDHLVSKRVHIGYKDLSHVIAYEVVFTVPEGERHTLAQFEALTGYMPSEFSRFWKFDRASHQLQPLDDGPGEQPCPVVLATPSGSHAMGIYSPDHPDGYGRFRFKDEKVNKWNCVFRVRDFQRINPGKYAYRMFVAVGSLEDARRARTAGG